MKNNVIAEFVERIENLERSRKDLADDIKDIYTEAKGQDIDVKALRRVIALRRQDRNEREALAETVEQYMHALGDLAGTPLGAAAVERHARTVAGLAFGRRRSSG